VSARRRPGAIATGLLILMAALYVPGRLLQDVHPAWGFLRAFAEAGLVGGLADWFAVTAIFRHPLGLPIPHTAVIPRSQGRIADALGAFIVDNFLQPALVAERLAGRDLALGIARALADPRQAARLADSLVAALPQLADLVDDETVAAFLRRQLAAGAGSGRAAGLAGHALAAAAESGRAQVLVDAALAEGWRALEAHQGAIRQRVRARSPWFSRLIGVDAKAADAIIGALADTLCAVTADAAHPLRAQANAGLRRFAEDLQTDPALRAQLEALIDEALAHPALRAFGADLWRDVKARLRDDGVDPPGPLRRAIAAGIVRIGEGLAEDDAARAAINAHLRALAAALAARHGGDVASIVSETIRSWDAQTMTAKLEQSVGDDLQYVRINGALIGGVVGVALHTISVMLP
jgi:uncharacterized membrane-anchored protein YjiN (DUF445 family)